MHCSIITVTYNSEKYINKMLECIDKQTHPPQEVIIVDTGSKNRGYLFECSKKHNVKIFFGEKDSGFCKGNNLGMRHLGVSSDYLLFLNPDAFLAPDFLEKATKYMEGPQKKDVGAITGKTLGYDILKDAPTGKYDSLGIFRTWYGRWYDRSQSLSVSSSDFLQEEEIPAICGAVFFCRKEAIENVLLEESAVFDPSFYMYKEDIDLSLRLKKAGWKLMFVPELSAFHCRGWDSDRQKIPKFLRLHSAKNELTIHRREKFLPGIIYSFIKLFLVKVLNC